MDAEPPTQHRLFLTLLACHREQRRALSHILIPLSTRFGILVAVPTSMRFWHVASRRTSKFFWDSSRVFSAQDQFCAPLAQGGCHPPCAINDPDGVTWRVIRWRHRGDAAVPVRVTQDRGKAAETSSRATPLSRADCAAGVAVRDIQWLRAVTAPRRRAAATGSQNVGTLRGGSRTLRSYS